MNIIETHSLGKSYGTTKALHDCNLAIPEGHVAALVGPGGLFAAHWVASEAQIQTLTDKL